MKYSLRGISRWLLVAACAIASFSLTALPASAASQAPSGKKHVPAAVANGLAPYVSHVAADQQYELAIALPVRDEAGLDKLMVDQKTPGNANYHHWLSVDQFANRFAPSPAEYAKVVSYLRAQGFAIEFQHANRLVVSFTGNTEQIERAFHVTMNDYRHPTEDRTFYAPDREPTITGLGVKVLLIAGLDNYVLPHSMLKNRGQMAHATPVKQNAVSRANPPVSCYGSPYSVDVGSGPCNTYTPANMRTAYYGGSAYDGTGQQIGILGFGGFYPGDLTGFAAVENMSVPTVVFKLGSACANSCSDGEQMLDVLWSYGMAPGITGINFFTNNSNDLTIINAEASSTLSSVYTSSWGWGFGNHTAEDTDFKEMQTQGQTFMNATGDDGGYNSSTWSFPSADPYITEVGGTQLVTNGIGGAWSAEYGWPDSSGGIPPSADRYAIPTWQAGAVNTSNGVSATYRSDPDVAAEADYEMLGCEGSRSAGNTCEDTYGGTSYAAPQWAGVFAMMNQASVAAGNGTIGFANQILYAAGENSSFSNVFHDVTACGGIDSGEGPGPDCNSSDEGTPVQGYNTVAGFDDVTGWGAPNVPNLLSEVIAPTLTITGCTSGCTRASSFTFAITYPDFNGTATFTATQNSTTVSIGTCSLTSDTCSITDLGSAIGVGTFTIQAYYQETSTGTKRYTSTQMITIAADVTATSASANPSSIGSTASTVLTASVSDVTLPATAVTGSVAFTDTTNSASLGSCTLSSGSCSLTVQASALATGLNSISANYASSTDFAASSGTTSVTVAAASGGGISFTSVSHNFGQVAVGTAATSYGIVITNSSTTTAYPFSLVFTPANGFTSANSCGSSIAAGAHCDLQFYFTPTKTGAVSATWSLAAENGFTYSPSNGGTLSGSGTSSGGVSLTSAGHNFGTVAVGTTSPTYGTELSNSTTSAETLSLGTVSAPFHMLTNCGSTLAAGSSCEIEFTYMPTTTSPVSVVVPLSGSPAAITAGGAALPGGGITLSGN